MGDGRRERNKKKETLKKGRNQHREEERYCAEGGGDE